MIENAWGFHSRSSKSLKIALICTHGGHLTETLQLLEAFIEHDIFFVTHHSIRDEEVQKIAPVYFLDNMAEKPSSIPIVILNALFILIREKPDVILSLGADIALPFYIWGRLLSSKTIFIESYCRIESLSRTGRIAYWLVDIFWVQWPKLLSQCGTKARYKGAVI